MTKNKHEDRVVNSPSETKDYGCFSPYPGSRDVNRAFLRRLKKVIKEKPLPIPIVVNESFQIIDGQHTFLARKALGLPIFYLVKFGTSLKDKHPFLKPVIVNEKHELIDGQARVKALEELGLPIEYIVIPGLDLEDAKMLNIHQLDYPAHESEYTAIPDNKART